MLNSIMLFSFFVLDRKRPSRANLILIVNIYSLRWNLIETNSIMQNSMTVFTFFPSDMLFLGKFGPKYQNCEFKSKFGS